ncbi:hypothetical protein EMIT048CA2_270013 [Pseudomonas chlororaphis]
MNVCRGYTGQAGDDGPMSFLVLREGWKAGFLKTLKHKWITRRSLGQDHSHSIINKDIAPPINTAFSNTYSGTATINAMKSATFSEARARPIPFIELGKPPAPNSLDLHVS